MRSEGSSSFEPVKFGAGRHGAGGSVLCWDAAGTCWKGVGCVDVELVKDNPESC